MNQKFYRAEEADKILAAVKEFHRKFSPGENWYPEMRAAFEMASKIEPVSVPEFDRQLAAEKERRTFWFRDGAEWENERIRKHMEGEK